MRKPKTSAIDVIKRPYSQSDYSDEKTLLDLLLCAEDPVYFMRTYMRIQHATRGSLPFNPYPFQERILKALHEHRNNVVMCARQSGKTTCAAGYLLWRAMFVPDSTILITANKYVQAIEVMDRVRYAYENISDAIRCGVIEYNKGTISFDNGSRIVSRATSTDAGRGLSISLLYCLAGETTVKVRDKETGEIQEVTLEELYNLL